MYRATLVASSRKVADTIVGPAPPVPAVKKLNSSRSQAPLPPSFSTASAAIKADTPGQIPHETTHGAAAELASALALRASGSSSQTSQYGTPSAIAARRSAGSVRCWNGPAVWITSERPATASRRRASPPSRSISTNFVFCGSRWRCESSRRENGRPPPISPGFRRAP